jgi:hypothetical protein
MAEFKQLIGEIRKTIFKILLFDTFIESLLVFLCLYILLFILNLHYFIALISSVVYFVVMLLKKRGRGSIKKVEQKYPILNEALTTAKDTIEEDNYLVNELRQQVKGKVKNVTASTFIDIKGDILKVIFSVGLVFVIVALSICKGTSDTCRSVLDKTDVKSVVDKIEFEKIFHSESPEEMQTLDIRTFSRGDDLDDVNADKLALGDGMIAKLGTNKVKIKIKLSSDQIDIHDVSEDVTEKQFIVNTVGFIEASSDVSFEENIPKEQKDIVKNYFKTISR